ncbi:2Fe-2S iron-sulfur cluster-binding protein [Flavobacterium hercynium]|uniref:2Fe-2S ferredoxin n=1 Tax=Flavobacterium hercynium TaxID=387094 RepID=A0A226H899_9FLAO|nr:2Fe-2S iron-sulfur cluster-binding protein [Flavobacterium hercynium]OXA90455.1 2Fe-2S ferredoxin [Flavobacterium hercynium]SMP26396.1 xanthine dehydrogenase YagT iron-sulfur-binding subunit [Flavobacterium hercynium]
MAAKRTIKSKVVEEESNSSRRDFIKKSSLLTAFALAPPSFVLASENKWDEKIAEYLETVPLSIEVNGTKHNLNVEPRTTLLDLLREQLFLTGTKKGCDHGQCGACTVHVDGVRILSCLSLASMQQNAQVTTIEGLSKGKKLHPMQEAFIKNDGFQCGYCTPGQIMSGIACIKEGHANSREEIREYMSGNICRCGAYHNIVDAITEVKEGGKAL